MRQDRPPLRRRLRRWSRPLRHQIAFWALRSLVGLLRALPLRWALAAGAGLGRAIGPLARRDHRRMREQLARGLPSPPTPGRCWADLGRRVVELSCADRMLPHVEIDPQSRALLDAAWASRRGVVIATCHLGNWELMAAALTALGYPVCAVGAHGTGSAGELGGPLHRWLSRERRRLGVEVLSRGGARALIRRLRAGDGVGLFIDQAPRPGARRALLPFLGRPAPTPDILPRLLRLSGGACLFAWTAREHGRHRIHVERPGPDPLAWCTQRVEALVRRFPAQWVWLHPRWPDGRSTGKRRTNMTEPRQSC